MKRSIVLIALVALVSCKGAPPPAPAVSPQMAAWQARAAGVTIVRDDWGIPHITGKTDADAVFGLMYAQAEDDFNRVETNFINAMGRLAEAEGEKEIYRDLRMKLFIDPVELKAEYEKAPDWLKALMTGWADGLNYYLATHPDVKPRVITTFEPWMALSFSEGSIGGDIESGVARPPQAFTAGTRRRSPASNPIRATWPCARAHRFERLRRGPRQHHSGKALLWINPHTSFYFRSELQMTSDEGLDAYGAVTWGQFFVYQGFNRTCGWMHTSSGVDNIDEFLETIVQRRTAVFTATAPKSAKPR
jgi:acyl-homoserine-lactone acylase